MKQINKPTRCANTEQTKTEKPQHYFTETANRVKLEFIRFVVLWGD